MLADTLMDFMGLTEDLTLVNVINREGCCQIFVMQNTYASPAHDLERLTKKGNLWLRM